MSTNSVRSALAAAAFAGSVLADSDRRWQEPGAGTPWRVPGAKAKSRAKDKAACKARRLNRK